jgi:hypothetical protein
MAFAQTQATTLLKEGIGGQGQEPRNNMAFVQPTILALAPTTLDTSAIESNKIKYYEDI